MWPQMTFQREMMQQRTGDIKHSLSDYDSAWFGQIWCKLEVPNFFTIDIIPCEITQKSAILTPTPFDFGEN